MAIERFHLADGTVAEVDLGQHNEPAPCVEHAWELRKQADDFQEIFCTRCGAEQRL